MDLWFVVWDYKLNTHAMWMLKSVYFNDILKVRLP